METLTPLIDSLIYYFFYLIDLILHIDVHLNSLAVVLGPWLYVILFLIVFAETGLVVTPILPGDSLLFAAGAIAAIADSPINVVALMISLIIAAILGDAVNYFCGKYFGEKLFQKEDSRLFNKNYLRYAQEFYAKHGGKTIVIARFVPIIRTFAPFVAGMGQMNYRRFGFYNVTGAVAWVVLFTLGGYGLGNLPAVKQNFHIVIFAIIFVSILPGIFEFWRHRKKSAVA